MRCPSDHGILLGSLPTLAADPLEMSQREAPESERKCHGDIRHADQFHRSGHPQRQGHRQSSERLKLATQLGCTLKEIYWTQGQYDVVSIVDAPDDAAATALAMSVAKLGFIRTHSMRAFTLAELAPIMEKVV